MIASFRSRRLRRLYERGQRRFVPPDHIEKVEAILAQLDVATAPQDMNMPGFRLHPLHGDLEGFWAVNVSGNWRIIFRFVDGNAAEVDYLDYHSE